MLVCWRSVGFGTSRRDFSKPGSIRKSEIRSIQAMRAKGKWAGALVTGKFGKNVIMLSARNMAVLLTNDAFMKVVHGSMYSL